MSQQHILLASASPRRAELLQQIGVEFVCVDHAVTEQRHDGEPPAEFVARMSLEKAQSALQLSRLNPQFSQLSSQQLNQLPSQQSNKLLNKQQSKTQVVLGADTVVVCDDVLMGKPANKSDGLAMLALLSGREHLVMSAVSVGTADSMKTVVCKSWVSFRAIDRQEMEAYWATGESLGKAGAYAIQGYAAIFISQIKGSYSGVMGLPLYETMHLLKHYNISHWAPAKFNL